MRICLAPAVLVMLVMAAPATASAETIFLDGPWSTETDLDRNGQKTCSIAALQRGGEGLNLVVSRTEAQIHAYLPAENFALEEKAIVIGLPNGDLVSWDAIRKDQISVSVVQPGNESFQALFNTFTSGGTFTMTSFQRPTVSLDLPPSPGALDAMTRCIRDL